MTGSRPTQYRDHELGALLRDLDVPAHRTTFEAELSRRLSHAQESGRGLRRIRRMLPLAAAAAALAAVAVLVGLPRTQHTPRLSGPDAATAAVVKRHLRNALSTVRTLTGDLSADGPTRGSIRQWRFALDAKGSFRLEGPTPGELVTYDATTGVARSAQRSASVGGRTLFYAERIGVAPGSPDQGPPDWILPDELAPYVRAALAAGDTAVHETSHDGRPAWRMEIERAPDELVPALSGDQLELTVDQETGMPVRVVETKRGAILHELRIDNLRVNVALPADAFALTMPPGAEVSRTDEGFRRVALGDVSQIVGYAPLVPAALATGYRLSDVAVATVAAPSGTSNPPSRQVVSLAYRRGLDRLVVTSRLRGSEQWRDPFSGGAGFADREERFRLAHGALAGSVAHLGLAPPAAPHLWAETDRLVVTVSGSLDRRELIALAESLTPGGR